MKYQFFWSLKINFVCCRPNIDFEKYKEQYIDDEIALNEEGVMDLSSTQNKFFMVHQASLEELVIVLYQKNAQYVKKALSKKLLALPLHF